MKRSSIVAAGLAAVTALAVPAFSAAQDEELAQEETAVEVDTAGTDMGDAGGDTGGLSVGGLLGYTVDFEDGDLNPYGITLGGRVGYTLANNLYLGGTAVYYVGDSEDGPGFETSWSMLQFGVEVGYDIPVSSLIIRPYAGLGLNMAFFSAKIGTVEDSDSETDLYLNLGGQVLYPINNFFVGGDLKLCNVFAEETLTGLMFGVVGGVNL